MTQEDKELLLKDLCSRLPYGVKCQYHHIQEIITDILIDINMFGRVNIDGHIKDICDIKPYLFPLSSMTEEQKEEFDQFLEQLLELELKAISDEIDQAQVTAFEIDFYNKHHFDWRGFIKKGLAIDATNLNIY